jgi:hypothetical protein
MTNKIKIQKESLDFLNLQITGECDIDARKRLMLIFLTCDEKILLKPLQAALQFGEPVVYDAEQLKAIQSLLNKIKKILIDTPVTDLINYLSLITKGSRDEATLQNCQRYYNNRVSNINKYLRAM